MMDALSQSWLTIALPIAMITGSMLVSKFLKLSLLGTILAACMPLALPFVDLPFSQELTHRNPHYLIGAGWLVLMSLAVGWVVVRPLASSALQNFGLIKCGYVLLLAAALAVVGLLLGNPVVLSTYVPGWKGTAGMVLLCASMLSMSLALIRFFRAAVFLAVWSFVSLVLASEIFLGKLPQQVIREDIDKIEDLFPSAKVNAILKKYGVDDDILRVREVLEES
jgi:hypothetical protein